MRLISECSGCKRIESFKHARGTSTSPCSKFIILTQMLPTSATTFNGDLFVLVGQTGRDIGKAIVR